MSASEPGKTQSSIRETPKSASGSFTHILIALAGAAAVALAVVWFTREAAVGTTLGLLGTIGFGVGIVSTTCMAFAHGRDDRSTYDYVGKLMALAVVTFTGVAAMATVPQNVLHVILLACGPVAVLLFCALIVVRARNKEKASLEKSDRVAPKPGGLVGLTEPPYDEDAAATQQ